MIAANGGTPEVAVRRMPAPYRALLAICSDLDETPDTATYVETARFLNATGPTRYGDGIGIEAGNTIYFDMPPDQFAYWNTDDQGRAAVRALIASGHVDCLHSFGDLATTRAHAARALEELHRHGHALSVWIDHGVAPTNFGADIMRGSGDVTGAPAYHADLTCSAGVRYVSRGRATSVIGQGVPRRLGGIFHSGHPAASARTWAKEAAKGIVARLGHPIYRLHASNQVLQPISLRSGHRVQEFLRANPHWGGVSSHETAAGIGDVLVESMLDRLVARNGACILYTHLGKLAAPGRPFTSDGIAALRRLARYEQQRRIKTLTTRRLLDYWSTVEHVQWTASTKDGALIIDVRLPAGTGGDGQGLTFYVPDPARARIVIDGAPAEVCAYPPDHTGRASVTVPFRPLVFPDVGLRTQAAAR